VVKITARPGETFLDRMIALVEGADRQKTPNEIALSILLAGLTIIFLLAVVTLQPFAVYSGAKQSIIVLVALAVALDAGWKHIRASREGSPDAAVPPPAET
jgi:K+-transporting ATPase ATPase B chain